MSSTITGFKRNGYGQVEPNQLSAQKTGQIYASLPLNKDVKILQNGEFMYYDYATGTVTAVDKDGGTPIGEPMLVFNEVKLYEPFWQTSYKDFAMIRVGDNYVTSRLATERYDDGALNTGATIDPHTEYGYRMDGIAPRLFKTNIGDVFTTNMVKTGVDYEEGKYVAPEAVDNGGYKTLVLAPVADATAVDGMLWVIAKAYTMPDGQHGIKIQRVQ